MKIRKCQKKLKEITFYFELRTHGFTFKMLLLQRKKVKRTQTKQFDKKGTKKPMFPKHLIIVLTSQHNIQLRLPKRVQFMDIVRYLHATCWVRGK